MMIVLGLGANMDSAWGPPVRTLQHALLVFGAYGICVKDRSPFYESAPLGIRAQPDFVNAVVAGETALPPQALLKRLKDLERQAGRRSGRRWGPRPLDIDILDYAGRILNWPSTGQRYLAREVRGAGRRYMSAATRRGPLMVPHPELHLREFVLQPLADILPRWHHPVSGESAEQLLAGLRGPKRAREGKIRKVLKGSS